MSSSARPTIMIVLGATGDLMARKITPALYRLWHGGCLPAQFELVGLAGHVYDDAGYRQWLADKLQAAVPDADRAMAEQLYAASTYTHGRFEQPETFQKLVQLLRERERQLGQCANKLIYLAVPPLHYKRIFHGLAESGLMVMCEEADSGWIRILVEKPFGSDAEKAEQLDLELGQLFAEEHVFRIDHYLAKELLQNILTFRFSNGLFEPLWQRQYIERIELEILETATVAHRGGFFDGLGALRDVGQNHLLQMLALVTMEQPTDTSANAIRAARAMLLTSVSALPEQSWRGQYDGYRQTPDVASGSTTETAFRLPLQIDSPRWQGVPIFLTAGKAAGENRRRITVTFKRPERCLGPNDNACRYNQVIFSLEDDSIAICFSAKQPGRTFATEPKALRFVYAADLPLSDSDEYERLLLDAVGGDQTLFVSTAEMAAMWQTVEPVLTAWQTDRVPLTIYPAGANPFIPTSA